MKSIACTYVGMFLSCVIFFGCTKDGSGANTNNYTSAINSENRSLLTVQPGDTLVARGDTSRGDQTLLLHSGYGGYSTPNFVSFTALGQNFGGIDGHDRSIMKFKVNVNTDENTPTVKKALLYLYQYHRAADNDPYSEPQDASNSVELHRIVSRWDEDSVVWRKQPRVAAGSANPLEDVVIIPAVATPLPAGTNDDQVIDVTDMINKIISTKNNQGILMKLNDNAEQRRYGRAYGSVTCDDVSKRPKLVVYF